MSYLPAYFNYLVNNRGLESEAAVDVLVNKFASAAQRKWFFANLAADKATGGGGGGKSSGAGGGESPPKPGKPRTIKVGDKKYQETSVPNYRGADKKAYQISDDQGRPVGSVEEATREVSKSTTAGVRYDTKVKKTWYVKPADAEVRRKAYFSTSGISSKAKAVEALVKAHEAYSPKSE